MCPPDELTIIPRVKGTPVSQSRYRWLAYFASAAIHLTGTAFAVSAYRQSNWRMDVARGKAMNLTVVLSSRPSQESSVVELESEAVMLDADARVDEERSIGEPVDSRREILYEVAEEDLSPKMNLDSSPGVQTMSSSTPVVTPPEVQRRREKRKPMEMVSIAGAVPVIIKEQPVGASFDQPPSKLPENKPPVYPPDAQRTRREGRVLLAVVVNINGTVEHVRVSETSGHADLDQAALDAVANWRFRPATLKGQNVLADVLVPVKFSIRR
jgi:periplasmic protein TonB